MIHNVVEPDQDVHHALVIYDYSKRTRFEVAGFSASAFHEPRRGEVISIWDNDLGRYLLYEVEDTLLCYGNRADPKAVQLQVRLRFASAGAGPDLA